MRKRSQFAPPNRRTSRPQLVGRLICARALELSFVAAQALAIATAIAVARYAGATTRGHFASFVATTQTIGLLAGLSQDRVVGSGRSMISSYLQAVQSMGLALLLATIGAIAVGSASRTPIDSLYFVAAASSIASLQPLYGLLISQRRMGTLAALRLTQPVLASSATLGLLIFRSAPTATELAAIYAISVLAQETGAIWLSRSILSRDWTAGLTRSHFKISARLHPFQVVQMANNRIDILILTFLAPADAIGRYAVAASIAKVPQMIGTAGFLRGLAGEAKTESRYRRHTLTAVAICVGLCVILPEVAVTLAGRTQYGGVVWHSRVLMVGSLIYISAQRTFGRLVRDQREKALAVTLATGSALTIVTIALYPTTTGAAIGSSAGWALSGVLTLALGRRLSDDPDKVDC